MASPTQQSSTDSANRYPPPPLPPKAVYPAPAPARLVVLVSGSGSNLQALLDATADPSYGATVVAVGADRDGILALKRAEDAGVPTFVRRLREYPDRAAWDRALRDEVVQHAPDLVVCAGFMKLLGPDFLAKFGGRIVNTHPALLPSFPGMHGARDALAYGVKVTGCTLFVVADGVDDGPIIAQAAVPVEDDDDESSLHERIKVAERRLLVEHVGRMVREGWTITSPAAAPAAASAATAPAPAAPASATSAGAISPSPSATSTSTPTLGNRKVTIP